ncbi:MAG: hypothetical protein LRZ85_08750 [Alphaproteobacteria bacterium]|nr:hypothetical protein [Alphaproteobacteria bacterium]MCD8570160.1 hypothetical protein [Alphaproteobacteria bacterium]
MGQKEETNSSRPLRQKFIVIDGQTGHEKPYVAEGGEVQVKPQPTPGVRELMKPENWPGPASEWW